LREWLRQTGTEAHAGVLETNLVKSVSPIRPATQLARIQSTRNGALVIGHPRPGHFGRVDLPANTVPKVSRCSISCRQGIGDHVCAVADTHFIGRPELLIVSHHALGVVGQLETVSNVAAQTIGHVVASGTRLAPETVALVQSGRTANARQQDTRCKKKVKHFEFQLLENYRQ